MYLIPFRHLFKEIAYKEMRSIKLTTSRYGIPADDYALFESYCPDLDCDCQRVLLNVFAVDQGLQVGSISYSFDRDSENAGPYLDPLHPRAAYAKAMLDLVYTILESDPDYVSRLKKHYALVKAAIDDPNAQLILKKWQQEEQEEMETDPLQVKLAGAKAILDDISRDSEKPKRRRKRGRRRRRKTGD